MPIRGCVGIQLIDPEVTKGQLIDSRYVINFFGIIHGVIGGAEGRGLGILRMGAPDIVIPLKHIFRKKAETDNKDGSGEKVGETGEKLLWCFGEKYD